MTKTIPSSQFRINFSGCILFLILLLGLFSCTGGLEGKLVGTWRGSDFLFQKTEGPDLVATINGGLDQHLDSKLILNKDGTYEMLVREYDNGKGTWVLEDDRLITTGESGNELVYQLFKVTDNELIIRHEVTLDTPMGELVGKITLSYSR
ncbi:hypothetical protein U3A58_20930 [Algoriphagus sp. C2-6-M1]|uniref:lipocalin family protein n=1 Tax=Algoriphagus persicinus TaxID=3108754 RepID=UPI002B39B769|nr:lipocalin family protein [Algoriphagus sp. C2-6-M1]MEB2782857.1 hypothetical protein [Algoriphagus sp. C2-6-M1]